MCSWHVLPQTPLDTPWHVCGRANLLLRVLLLLLLLLLPAGPGAVGAARTLLAD
jgi:hypothetical protein